MEHFNLYSQFLLEFYEPESKVKNTSKKDVSKEEVSYQDFDAEFNNSFGYNKTEIDEEGYNPDIQTLLANFQKFIQEHKTKNGKNPTINNVDVVSRGAASWVSTNYPDENSNDYNYENNKKLSNDRGSALGARILEDTKKYLSKQGYDANAIKFNVVDIAGVIKNKESRQVLTSFVKDNFSSNKENLVAQMADAAGGKGKIDTKRRVKFFKDPNAAEELKTRTIYEDDKQYYEVYSLEATNADRIYELLSETPAYVTFTARLKAGDKEVRALYKDNAQTANVKLIINAQSKTKKVETEEPVSHPQKKEGKKFDVKSIPFKKDSANLASKAEFDYLVSILRDPKNKIKYLFLVGHSEADDELGKKVFSPTSKNRLTQKSAVRSNDKQTQLDLDKKQHKLRKKVAAGVTPSSQHKQTFYLEYMLEDLRFILGLERVKKVARLLKKNVRVWTTSALTEWRMQGVSVGTKYGTKLANQKIVQVYVETADGTKSDSESQLNLFRGGFNKNIAARKSMNHMKQLGHKKPSNLYDQHMQKQQLADSVIKPTYRQMVSPRNHQEARIYYNFRNSF